MINTRLIKLVPQTKPYVIKSVIWQEISLIANIAMISSFGIMFEKMYEGSFKPLHIFMVIAISLLCMILRSFAIKCSNDMNYVLARQAKKGIRNKLYEKLISFGQAYKQKVSTSEAVQICSEGVEQLEMYFGAYLPQFFYAMLAPLTLFLVILSLNAKVAIILFIGVPLIPISIALVQTIAKKLLAKYWNQYLNLGDSFLENLQGLTTLKIYQADEYRHQQMNEEAQTFRKVTMKVLKMQLNSIIIMDLVAFGGAALAMMMSFYEMKAGNLSLGGAIIIILLSADFFIPMRQLGSFFHVAMNGMAAAKKMFSLLDEEVEAIGMQSIDENSPTIELRAINFSYDQKPILKNINMHFKAKGLVSIVGESGSGKSTVAGLISGKLKGYEGEISISNIDISKIAQSSLSKAITSISYFSYIFKGDVRSNLLMANPNADDEMLEYALKKVNLYDELYEEGKVLDRVIENEGSNLSGGQRQRLSLARALLHDSPVYIFDEATSNIDVESENAIMNVIYELAKYKSVILITHRLFNALLSDKIYVLKSGEIVESGTHQQLLNTEGEYAKLWNTQQNIELFIEREVADE